MISLYNLINHKQYYVALLEHDTLHLSFVSTYVCLYLLKYQLSCKAIKTSGISPKATFESLILCSSFYYYHITFGFDVPYAFHVVSYVFVCKQWKRQ